jgi:transposase
MAAYSHPKKGDGTMPICKKCGSGQTVKSGVVAGKQRFLCKECGCNFREGDARTNEKIAAKKALCVLLYAMAKGSFRMMGKILNTNHALVYRWIRAFGESLPEPAVSGSIQQMQFDEMWHFIGSKKENFGSSKLLIVAHGKLWDGCSAVVILKLFDDSMEKSVI